MLTIQYTNPSQQAIATHGDNFGRVYLDVDTAFEVRLTKALDQLDELEQVSQEAALSGSLPATQKNRALLEQFRGDVINRNSDRIEIEVIQDGERLPLSGAAVLGFDEATKTYEFEMFGADWLDALGDFVLRDLVLEYYEWTAVNVAASWAGDRQAIAMPGLAHYGGWNTPGDITLDDLRFWFNLGLVLKECFCKIGWSFESPHYDSGDGQYIYGYLAAKNWHWYEGKEDLRWVHLNIASPRIGPATQDIITFDEVYDPFDLYNNALFPDLYLYGAPTQTVIDIRFQFEDFEVILPPSPPGEPAYYFVIGMFKSDNGVSKFLHTESYIGSTDQEKKLNINFEYIEEDATGGDLYGVYMTYENIGQGGGSRLTYELNSGDLYIRPDQAKYITGDTIALADLLSNEITGKDLFEGMANLINGKITTDYAAKKVTLYAPYDYNRQDLTGKIRGFYLRNLPALDLRSKTVKSQTAWDVKERTQDRYRKYAFADNKDQYLKSDEIFSRRIDLGVGEPKTKDIKNPLFQATGEILTTTEEVGGDGVYMPALWDNDSGNLSSEIVPRVANFYGLIDQGLEWSFNGVIQTTVPYLAQVSRIGLPDTVDFVPITYSGYLRDIFTMFYKAEVLSCQNAVAYKLILTGGDDTYQKIDFRRTIIITGEDSDLEVQPTSVKDHLAGSRVPLLVEGRLI